MHKHKLAAQPIEVLEFPLPQGNVEVQGPEKWVQEEEKLKNQRIEWEHPQERAQRLIPGLDLKRFFL
jgi:hypothetical protein